MERQLLAWGKLHTSLSGSSGHPSTYPALPSSSGWVWEESPGLHDFASGSRFTLKMKWWSNSVPKIVFVTRLYYIILYKCILIYIEKEEEENINEAEAQTSCSVMRSTHSCRSSLSRGVRIFRINCSSWPSTRMRKLRTSDMKRLYTDSSCSSVDHQRARHSRWVHQWDSMSKQQSAVCTFVCQFLGEDIMEM